MASDASDRVEPTRSESALNPTEPEAGVGFESLQLQLDHSFAPDYLPLLERAFTHRSFANERSGGQAAVNDDNERLEFLGDAVLDLGLSALLMKRFPLDSEGSLSKKRASLVNEDVLSRLALELRLDGLLKLGKGEIKTGGLQKPRILASTFEALMGAVFLDSGFDTSLRVIEKLFTQRLDEVGASAVDFQGDFKTRLQELSQELHRSTPFYKIEGELGPDHDKTFTVSVWVNDQSMAVGQGRSKKAAEQEAARLAFEKMNENRAESNSVKKA